jgi:hypothetical protein
MKTFFGGPGICTQSLLLAKKVLYHLSHSSIPFESFKNKEEQGRKNSAGFQPATLQSSE